VGKVVVMLGWGTCATMRHKQSMACASVRPLVYAHQQPTRTNRRLHNLLHNHHHQQQPEVP
jgi:hypothetical protein